MKGEYGSLNPAFEVEVCRKALVNQEILGLNVICMGCWDILV